MTSIILPNLVLEVLYRNSAGFRKLQGRTYDLRQVRGCGGDKASISLFAGGVDELNRLELFTF